MAFEWDDATISMKELTIGDEDRIGALMSKISTGTLGGRYTFAEFMIGANVKRLDLGGMLSDAPVTMVTEHDKPEDIEAAWQEWRNLPRKFAQLWRKEVEAADGGGDEKND